MSYRKFLISVSAILLLSFSGQSQPALRGLNKEEAAAIRKKAIALLESVATQVDGLRSAENRARIGSNLGELLWTHDEKRARTLFAAVKEDIKTGFNQAEADDSTAAETLLVFWHLRRDTLERIAKHDPELALEFLRTSAPPSHIQFPYQMRDAEKSLESRLAVGIVATNPALALKLGRQSLAKGFSRELQEVLSKLRWKDSEATLSLSAAIVDKLKSAKLAEDQHAMAIALYLAHSFQPPEVDEQVYRELMDLLLTSALSNGCADEDASAQICYQIGSLFSKLQGYYGQRAAPLSRWASDQPTSRQQKNP